MHVSDREGLGAREAAGSGSGADRGGAFRPTSARHPRPAPRRGGGGFLADAAFAWKLGGRAWGVRVSRAPRRRADFPRDASRRVEARAILAALSKTCPKVVSQLCSLLSRGVSS